MTECLDPDSATMDDLSSREREILIYEREWWRHDDAKHVAVRDRFAMSVPEYYRALNTVIDGPGALAHDHLLVRRLRRRRDRRRQQRSTGPR